MATLKSTLKTENKEQKTEEQKTEEQKTEEQKVKVKDKKKKTQVFQEFYGRIPNRDEEYTDEVFEAIKEVLRGVECDKRGINFRQFGKRLIIYQGNASNRWGIVEAKDNKPHFIRIVNALLLRILKSSEPTREIFKDIL